MKTFQIPRPPTPTPRPKAEDGYDSFRRIEPELASVRREDLLHVNLSVARACALVFDSVPRLMQLRPLIVEQLPRHPIESLDKLEDYALALYYMNAMTTRPRSDGSGPRLHAQVAELRASLLVAADALAHAGIFEASTLAQIRKGSGYLDVANDAIALSTLFRRKWKAVKGKTAVRKKDVERADVLGRELFARQGGTMQPVRRRTANDEQALVRDRCFTLFMRAYAECRAAAAYLRRHEGDAEWFAPNLFTKTKAERRNKQEDGAGVEAGPETAAENPKPASRGAAQGKPRSAR